LAGARAFRIVAIFPPLGDNSIRAGQGHNEDPAISDNVRLATQVSELSLGGGQ
jgi:hypothetical protein